MNNEQEMIERIIHSNATWQDKQVDIWLDYVDLWNWANSNVRQTRKYRPCVVSNGQYCKALCLEALRLVGG